MRQVIEDIIYVVEVNADGAGRSVPASRALERDDGGWMRRMELAGGQTSKQKGGVPRNE
jgi:hypothetical protein